MVNCRLTDGETRNFARCSTCDATITAEAEPHNGADANIVCATCGLPTVDWPSEGCSYFEVVMNSAARGLRGGPGVPGELISLRATLQCARQSTPRLLR